MGSFLANAISLHCHYIALVLILHKSDVYVRWVYEGVIDDPYGEFFIAENKSLQKVCHHLNVT